MANRLSDRRYFHRELLELFVQFGNFGKTDGGGVSRLASSQADGLARDYLCDWLSKNSCDVIVDQVGNIFGVLDLMQGNSDRYFYCGSHLDSQPNGGKFDGTYGVVCACITALAIKQAVDARNLIPEYRYLVVVCWTAEEGARFAPSLLGSGVFTGMISAQNALAAKDNDGITLDEALSKINYLGKGVGPRRPSHYFEIHIEQGSSLEFAGKNVGVVTACWGARKIRIAITGCPDHTGPTPMEDRQDALLVAAQIVIRVNKLAINAPASVHSSVGRMDIKPNSPNTIADRVTIWVEFRSGDETLLQDIERDLISSFKNLAEESGCQIEPENCEQRIVSHFDPVARARVETSLDEVGISHMSLPTIAGHDAVNLQKICPSTLIFVPSRGGISHSPEEFTSDEEMTVGLDGMIHAVANLISNPSQNNQLGVHHV